MTTKDEIKIFCDNKLASLKDYFGVIDSIAMQFYSEADILSFQQYGPIENKLVGMYTFINTIYKELDALTEYYFALHFNQLKVKAEIDSVKFVAEVAKHNAEEFVSDLRITTAILAGKVNNLEQLLCTCRRHLYVDKKEHKYG